MKVLAIIHSNTFAIVLAINVKKSLVSSSMPISYANNNIEKWLHILFIKLHIKIGWAYFLIFVPCLGQM